MAPVSDRESCTRIDREKRSYRHHRRRKSAGFIRVVSARAQTPSPRSGTLVAAGRSQPATQTEKVIEHDRNPAARNPAARQAGFPVGEDEAHPQPLERGTGRDLTCQPDRSARHYEVPRSLLAGRGQRPPLSRTVTPAGAGRSPRQRRKGCADPAHLRTVIGGKRLADALARERLGASRE